MSGTVMVSVQVVVPANGPLTVRVTVAVPGAGAVTVAGPLAIGGIRAVPSCWAVQVYWRGSRLVAEDREVT